MVTRASVRRPGCHPVVRWGAAAATLFLLTRPEPGHAQRWLHTVGTGEGSARAIALLPGGDAVAVGPTDQRPTDGTVVRLSGATGTELWRRDLAGTLAAGFNDLLAVATNASADGVFVAGRVENAGTSWDFTVARLRAADGSVLWRREIDGGGIDPMVSQFDVAVTVAVDALGNVVAGGGLVETATEAFTVVKLAGDGTVLWLHQIDPTVNGFAARVAVDTAGDVLAVGDLSSPAQSRFVVAKLAGATGAELWRYEIPGGGAISGLALDATGDVVAVGDTLVESTPGVFKDLPVAVKLAGTSGAEVWRTNVADGFVAFDVALDPSNDVVAGITLSGAHGQRDFGLVKLSGADGGELWRTSIPFSGCCQGLVSDVAIDATGDVFAVGTNAEARTVLGVDLTVVKVTGASGALLWRRELDSGGGQSLALDANGDVLAAGGVIDGSVTFSRFGVAKFSGATGGDYLLSGRRLAFDDPAPDSRKLTIVSSDKLFPAPLPNSASDPIAGGAGGSVVLVNPATAEQATIPLPAAGWTALGSPPGSSGYHYGDRHHLLGPCTQALVTARRTLVRCSGPGIPFSLDEPSQGSLGVRVSTGSGALSRCVLFGGDIQRDSPGSFLARTAHAPSSCP